MQALAENIGLRHRAAQRDESADACADRPLPEGHIQLDISHEPNIPKRDIDDLESIFNDSKYPGTDQDAAHVTLLL
ncbi:hypothetical protein CSUB01_10980 [Colletotrichum sublineola]|uniref:Uncharacterized protein n=1 Tax=Colletotrichum sublineola TaxID=1173701 RepID=A0A066WWP1_COLSU|nr:hypothetical protein CSUB01_10980 [Colletotrichum sublineola]